MMLVASALRGAAPIRAQVCGQAVVPCFSGQLKSTSQGDFAPTCRACCGYFRTKGESATPLASLDALLLHSHFQVLRLPPGVLLNVGSGPGRRVSRSAGYQLRMGAACWRYHSVAWVSNRRAAPACVWRSWWRQHTDGPEFRRLPRTASRGLRLSRRAGNRSFRFRVRRFIRDRGNWNAGRLRFHRVPHCVAR